MEEKKEEPKYFINVANAKLCNGKDFNLLQHFWYNYVKIFCRLGKK